MVGVQNSELLRLLSLSATLAALDPPGKVGVARVVRQLSMCLGDLVALVETVTVELESALKFNQNLMLGEKI